MKQIAGFIIFLMVVVGIIFLVSLLLPSRVTVAKSVEINANTQRVKNMVANFEQWKNWYPAFKDSGTIITKNALAKGVLNSVSLKDATGKTITLDLIDSVQNVIDINVISSSSTKVNYRFIIIPKINEATQLTWNVNINMGWNPFKKIQGIFLDKFSGSQYEAALENLKKFIEGQ